MHTADRVVAPSSAVQVETKKGRASRSPTLGRHMMRASREAQPDPPLTIERDFWRGSYPSRRQPPEWNQARICNT